MAGKLNMELQLLNQFSAYKPTKIVVSDAKMHRLAQNIAVCFDAHMVPITQHSGEFCFTQKLLGLANHINENDRCLVLCRGEEVKVIGHFIRQFTDSIGFAVGRDGRFSYSKESMLMVQ